MPSGTGAIHLAVRLLCITSCLRCRPGACRQSALCCGSDTEMHSRGANLDTGIILFDWFNCYIKFKKGKAHVRILMCGPHQSFLQTRGRTHLHRHCHGSASSLISTHASFVPSNSSKLSPTYPAALCPPLPSCCPIKTGMMSFSLLHRMGRKKRVQSPQ